MEKEKRRKLTYTIGIIAVIIATVFVWQRANSPEADTIEEREPMLPLTQEISYEAAKEDMEYTLTKLKDVHIATRNSLPSEVRDSYIEQEKQLPENPTVENVRKACAAVLSAMGDAQTKILHEDEQAADSDSTPLVEYSADKGASVAILTINGYEPTDEYKKVFSDFFSEVSKQKIGNIAADLRENYGGSLDVITELMSYIDVDSYKSFSKIEVRNGSRIRSVTGTAKNKKQQENLFGGSIYALTSKETAGAALSLAAMLSDGEYATVIGDIPTANPTYYGDGLEFQLPNTKLYLSISHKHFFRVDDSASHEPLTPDYIVSADKSIDKLYEVIR